ncbi:Flp family type IVb pilin [Eubacteriaceae bacterium ES3]|nr:Flp family type IVb pilin [Eubacteriaceae bacterium ES3]
MKNFLPEIIREEEGQGMVEYGLIIATAIVLFVILLGPALSGFFTEFAAALAAGLAG